MGRSPCCAKEGLNRGSWTASEDRILTDYIKLRGEGDWRNLPKKAGLKRCGKSCRLRWLNYLRPDIKRGNISPDEEELIIRLHKLLGNRWSLIAGRLPGRTDNEIKNYWNTNLCKKVQDPHCSDKSIKKKRKNPKMEINIESKVVRTKAMRCTKVFISPQLQKIESIDHKKGPPVPESISCSIGLSQFAPKDDNPTLDDLMLDVNMEDVFMSGILNSDFDGTGFFDYGGDKFDDLSASVPDGTLFCYKDMLEDWTLNNCLQPNGVG